jgi:hypothetical protein
MFGPAAICKGRARHSGTQARASGVPKMNEQAQACLRKAEECEHSEQRTTDENARLLYLNLANHWRTLAAHVETMDGQRAIFQQSEPKSEGT